MTWGGAPSEQPSLSRSPHSQQPQIHSDTSAANHRKGSAPRAGAAGIRKHTTWAARQRATFDSPAPLLSSCVTWAKPSASLDPYLGHGALQVSPSALGPGFKASSLAESKSIKVPLAFLVIPSPNQQGRLSRQPWPTGKQVQGTASLAGPVLLGPALVQPGLDTC